MCRFEKKRKDISPLFKVCSLFPHFTYSHSHRNSLVGSVSEFLCPNVDWLVGWSRGWLVENNIYIITNKKNERYSEKYE